MPNCAHGPNNHRQCLNEWRTNHDSCPECREPIAVFNATTLTVEEKIDYDREINRLKLECIRDGIKVGKEVRDAEILFFTTYLGVSLGATHLLMTRNNTCTTIGVLLTTKYVTKKYSIICDKTEKAEIQQFI